METGEGGNVAILTWTDTAGEPNFIRMRFNAASPESTQAALVAIFQQAMNDVGKK